MQQEVGKSNAILEEFSARTISGVSPFWVLQTAISVVYQSLRDNTKQEKLSGDSS